MRLSSIAALLFALGCAGDPAADTDDGSAGAEACDPAADTDTDGLDDCTEEDLGTDPAAADSDGDGLSDADEVDCVSDPLDADEQCYACGWAHNDPGHLASTGAGEGDVVADLTLVDQCGDDVALWDFAGSYTVAFLTAAWCPLCKDEASALGDEASDLAASTGQPVQGIVVLFEGRTGAVPTSEDAPAYADDIGA